MMLPTGDPLGTVVTMLATPFGRLDGLAIDTAGAGGWRPTGSPPDSTSEGVIDGLPGSVSFPRRKVVVDGPPWGKIVGQRSPDTAIAVAVEDGINHRPHLGLAWPPTDAGRRQEGLQDSPLLACQITGVWLWVHTLSTFETPFWNRLSERLARRCARLADAREEEAEVCAAMGPSLFQWGSWEKPRHDDTRRSHVLGQFPQGRPTPSPYQTTTPSTSHPNSSSALGAAGARDLIDGQVAVR